MSWRLVNLTLDTLADLPYACRGCVFWELTPVAAADADLTGDPMLEKEVWLSRTLLEWGGCGKLGYVNDTLAGFLLYAPPVYLPGGWVFPTAPASPDAVLLATARVLPGYAGLGLGRALVQAAARELSRRGVRAIEAFGDAWSLPGQPADLTDPAAGGCVAPAGFFTAIGFRTVRPHRRYPRLRLELRSPPGWRVDVERSVAEASDPLFLQRAPGQGALASLACSSRTSMEPVATSDSTG